MKKCKDCGAKYGASTVQAWLMKQHMRAMGHDSGWSTVNNGFPESQGWAIGPDGYAYRKGGGSL